jgi:hypothetical protein
MDLREHLGLGLRPLGLQLGDAAGHGIAAFLQDMHHVKGRAAAGAHQHQFHRADQLAAAAGGFGAAQRYRMPAAGLADEGPVLDPGDPRFHGLLAVEIAGAEFVTGAGRLAMRRDAPAGGAAAPWRR